MQKTLRFIAIVMLAWVVAGAATPLVSVAIRNSTIDSTPIGNSSPSSAHFLTFSAQQTPPNPMPSNSAAFGWNGSAGGGEADLVVNHGTGSIGGFAVYDTTGTWSSGSPIMRVSEFGDLSSSHSMTSPTVTATASLSSPIGQFAQVGATGSAFSTSNPQGSYTLFNASSAFGETDFVNSRGSGVGGFRWYSITTGGGLGAPEMYLDNNNALTVGSVNASFNGPLSGNVTGSVNGNANTASAFNHTPNGCGATNAGSTIDASGNALNCTHIPEMRSLTTGSCTTAASSFSSCVLTGNWSSPFTRGTPHVTCTLISVSDNRGYLGAMPLINTNGAQVNLITGGSTAVTGSAECIGIVD